MSTWFSELVLAWPSVAPAALAAVSAAVIAVLANPGSLGRHVYDELLEDVIERRRANGWDLEVAASALPVSTPDAIVGESDGRLEAAVREAAVRAESEVARVRQEAGLTLVHALEQARAEADRERAAAVRETQAAAAVELARVKQEAERTLAVNLQEARSEITAAAELTQAQALEQARGEADRQRDAAVREAQAAAAAELARVRQEAERTLAVKLQQARSEITAAAELTQAQALEQARGEAAAELARVKQEAERTLAAKLQEARAEAARERDAAAPEVRAAGAAVKTESQVAPPTPTTDVVPMAQNSASTRKQTIEEHIQEARALLARQTAHPSKNRR